MIRHPQQDLLRTGIAIAILNQLAAFKPCMRQVIGLAYCAGSLTSAKLARGKRALALDAHSLTTTQLCSTMCQLACRVDLEGMAAANNANRRPHAQVGLLRALGQEARLLAIRWERKKPP
jgi:hypothetical protein